jgi:hypothetical protein
MLTFPNLLNVMEAIRNWGRLLKYTIGSDENIRVVLLCIVVYCYKSFFIFTIHPTTFTGGISVG